jgi:hypothetical protein
MKGALIAVIAVVVLAVAGVLGLPVLMDQQLSGLKQDVQDVRQRLQAIEDASKVAPLPPDADAQRIIQMVNALALQVDTMEKTRKEDVSAQSEEVQKQKTATDEALKKQGEMVEKHLTTVESQLKTVQFNDAVDDIRQHILKARMEVIAKNLGTAKAEIDFIDDLFATLQSSAKDEQKRVIDELRAMVKKAKTEIDTDLPAFINRMNSVWHETHKLLI